MSTDVTEAEIPMHVIDTLLAGYTTTERGAAWVRWAWGELAQGGLVPMSLSPRRLRYADHLIVLATLCMCVNRFADADISDCESAEPADLTTLSGDWALSHSQLLHATRIEMSPDDEENTTGWLSRFAITEQEHALVRTLADVIGPEVLFASLWAICHGAPWACLEEDEFGDPVPEVLRFPLETDRLEGILQFDTTFDKMRMFEWLQEILSLH